MVCKNNKENCYKNTYDSIDEETRQTLIALMAQQGYVPKEELDKVKNDAEKKINNYKKESDR
ncbi:MAG: hypothetical protein JSW14_00985 [Candidatus Bathyarchaeum sp.]|nr:MAG: hypothetical protein JSW14_00985 [Candidatus Bathyarchaeum sp.]